MELTEWEIERLRRMTPAEKIAVMNGLIRQAFELKEAGLRTLHPEWSDEDIRNRTRELVSGEGS